MSSAPRPHDPVLHRAVRGDRSACAALVRAHGPMVWGLCRRLTPDPEDAYQAIWAKAFAALPDLDPDGPASFRTWLRTLAHRHLIDRHRRRTVRGEVVPLDRAPAHAADADVQVDASRRAAALEAAIATLPEPQRRVVVLHHLHGVPLAEIADEEGVAVGTVKSRLHRGRAALAAALGAPPCR